jgi:alpha/beta superfamily hydrolase
MTGAGGVGITFPTVDGERIAGEVATVPGARAAVVLCHPHPQFGGTMRSLVTSELFAALPTAGITALRFDFRGVGASTGAYDGGRSEVHDVEAAVSSLADHSDAPRFLIGWSFGADVALSTRDPAVRGWVAIAAPLRFGTDLDATGRDGRPKLVLLAEHDEFRSPDEVRAETANWMATECEIVGGASHFFVGRTAALAERATAWVLDQVAGS